MKRTWPPPQVILVGLELNQHGHAASHEQASSSWPVIFHGVLSFGSFAPRTGTAWTRKPATSAQEKSNSVFMLPRFYCGNRFSNSPIFAAVPACTRRPACRAVVLRRRVGDATRLFVSTSGSAWLSEAATK